jgi:hypothetical protein
MNVMNELPGAKGGRIWNKSFRAERGSQSTWNKIMNDLKFKNPFVKINENVGSCF